MTKSRSALATLLPLVATLSDPAFAQPRIETAEAALAAYDARFHELMSGDRRRCRRAAGEDDIVVCGRSNDAGMRVPYESEPGEVHAIAGDMPGGRDALAAGVCLRLCYQPVAVDLAAAVRFLARGVDRILHPD